MDLGLDVSERNGYSVLAVSGEVDVATVPRLREQLHGLVAQGSNKIIVNLDGVDFLDSTGLGVLVGSMGLVIRQVDLPAVVVVWGRLAFAIPPLGCGATSSETTSMPPGPAACQPGTWEAPKCPPSAQWARLGRQVTGELQAGRSVPA